jgi:sulfite reductase alpha subunit-like flavoprotein
MAKDVNNSLIKICQIQGEMTQQKSEEYIKGKYFEK